MSYKTLNDEVFILVFSLMAFIMFKILSSINDDIYVNEIPIIFFILKIYKSDHQKISAIFCHSFASNNFNL